MATGFIELLSTGGKVITAIWRQGSRFLLWIAAASLVSLSVLRLGVYFDVTRARGLWEEYGLFLILLAAVAGISAGFKYYAERRNRLVFLIADDQQSFWHHALQADGTRHDAVYAQISRDQHE